MSGRIDSFSSFASAASSTAGASGWVWLRVRMWIAWSRQLQALATLDDWILRDIGVIRERDVGAGLEEDPREDARQFWHP